jgi:hypothetical protein
MDETLLTFDVDWAPDWVIEDISDLLRRKEVKSTWFATHKSETIDSMLEQPELFEVGIHPNFLKGSTQGKNPREVLGNLKKLFPLAKSMRSHALYQSSELLKTTILDFDVKYDSSLFLPCASHISPHEYFLDERVSIMRFPYFWEDDEEFLLPTPSWNLRDKRYAVEGLKIFNFHPIHIALNSSSIHSYRKCTKRFKIPDLTREDAAPFVNSEIGVQTIFEELVSYLSQQGSKTLSELAAGYSKG